MPPKLTADITQPRWLAVKGVLFAIATVAASLVVILLALQHRPDWRLLFLTHSVALWCACRTYYFAFYVIHRYAGAGPYAGLLPATRAAITMLRHNRT